MSYYVATFGYEPDLQGIRNLGVLRGPDVPAVARRTMAELAETYRLGAGFFIVDESGDTAHHLLEEAWGVDDAHRKLGDTRLGELLTRAERWGAAIAAWDATWDERTSSRAVVFPDYSKFRTFIAQCKSVWDIAGVICIPHGKATSKRNRGV